MSKQSDCFFLDVFCVFGMVKAWVEQAGRPAQPKKKSVVKVDEFAGQALVATFTEDTVWGGLAGSDCVTFAAKANQCWSVTKKTGNSPLTIDDIITPSTKFVLGPNELVRFANLKGLSAADQARVKTLIAAGGQNLIAAGGQNLVAIEGKTLSEIASLISNENFAVPNLPAATVAELANLVGLNEFDTLLAAGGLNLIAAGGLNLIAAGGQNLLAAGGQNLVSAGGKDYSADSVLSFAKLIGLDASGLINLDGGSMKSVMSGALRDVSQITTAKLSLAVAKTEKIGKVDALMLGEG